MTRIPYGESDPRVPRREIDGFRLKAGSVSVLAQHQDGERVPTRTRASWRSVDSARERCASFEQQLARGPVEGGYLFPSRVRAAL